MINGKIDIIKGEKMIVLYCKILDFLINNFSKNLKIKFFEMIKMGIITSIDCNKAFISYFDNNLKSNYELCIVKTGIKNLQKESKKFDISICYDYNGLGIIYINNELNIKFGKLSSLIETSKDSQIIELFQIFISLFNIASSDSLDNLFNIELILKTMNLSIKDVFNFYEDIPYQIIDINIKDKNKFVTNDGDHKLLEPSDIKNKIEELINKFEKSRIFINPSEVENCLKIYVESKNHNKEIIEEISKFIKEGNY